MSRQLSEPRPTFNLLPEEIFTNALRGGDLNAIKQLSEIVESHVWQRRNAEELRNAAGDETADYEAIDRLVPHLKHLPEGHEKVEAASRLAADWRATSLTRPQAKNIAYRLLQSCEFFGRPLPVELVSLFRVMLGQDVPPHGYKAHAHKQDAVRAANDFVREHPDAGATEIARYVGVDRSTVYEWKKKGRLKFGQ